MRVMNLVLIVAVLGCAQQGVVAPEICVGSTELKLGALTLPPVGRLGPGEQVAVENGSSFLYVDGTCRYWVQTNRHSLAWESSRSGVLDDAGQQRVLESLQYGRWAEWDGDWSPPNGADDAAPLILYQGPAGQPLIACRGMCMGDPVPADLQAVAKGFEPLLDLLWTQAQDVQGPIRFVVVSHPSTDNEVPLRWPLDSLDPASIAISPQDASTMAYGMGRVTSTEEEAGAFRALRQEFRMTPNARFTPHIPVQDAAGNRYRFHMRDALPLEDERGLIGRPQG
jgi:hypothetical protein